VRMMETVEVRALLGIRICVGLAGTREIRAHTGGDRLEEALAEWFGHDMVDVLELDLQGGLMRGKCAGNARSWARPVVASRKRGAEIALERLW
jgi:hypothetical protein